MNERRIMILAAALVVSACTTQQYWVAPNPTIAIDQINRDSKECLHLTNEAHPELAPVDFIPVIGLATGLERADTRQRFYHDCMIGRGYSPIYSRDLRLGHGVMFYWFKPGKQQKEIVTDRNRCQEEVPLGEDAKDTLLTTEACMSEMGYALWTEAELDDYVEFRSSHSAAALAAYDACMGRVDELFPLSYFGIRDFIGRRELHAECMTERGFVE